MSILSDSGSFKKEKTNVIYRIPLKIRKEVIYPAKLENNYPRIGPRRKPMPRAALSKAKPSSRFAPN